MNDLSYSARLTKSTEPLESSLDGPPLANGESVFFSCVLHGEKLELDRAGTANLLKRLDAFGEGVSATCANLRENMRSALAAP